MNLVWALLILGGVVALSIGAMLFVRRGAPQGGYFSDGDRAAGVFGVLATGFSVLLGFIVFLSFESYDQSRSGAETEALTVLQQVENAQFFPAVPAQQLTGQLICYGRSVEHGEWQQMQDGTLGDNINPWSIAMFHTLKTVDPKTNAEQSAYDKWLDQTSAREQARLDRVHGAVGVIPLSLWIVLFFIAAVIFVFTLFFADSGERAVVQGLMMGSVVAVMTTLLFLLQALDHPFHHGLGGLQPTAMHRTLKLVDQALPNLGAKVVIPCNADGIALRS